MESKEKKVYQIILVLAVIVIGLLMCAVDSNIKKTEALTQELTQKEFYYNMGNELENWILDVVYETDLLDIITPEEKHYLDELEEEWYTRYCIELILLYQKYYGK